MKSAFIWLISVAVSISCAKGSTSLDTLDPQAYRDEAALYPMVGQVSGSGFSGSGVLISDHWVLTAGHVADFKTNGTFNIGGTNYTIQSYITHPNHGAFSTTYDVGLLYLSASVPGIEAATMFRFASAESILGREATWVGNGVTGTGLNDTRGPNELRAFTNMIDGVTPFAGLPGPSFYSDFDNPDATSNSLGSGSSPLPTLLEGNVTAGDSGGGVFVNVDGHRYLVGISSYTSGFVPGLNSKYGSLSGAADLNFFHSWVFDNTGISSVPEPAVFWILTLGCLLGLGRRRGL
ncbi:MAG: trypsin-like serine protease [Luteolibacter sp.]